MEAEVSRVEMGSGKWRFCAKAMVLQVEAGVLKSIELYSPAGPPSQRPAPAETEPQQIKISRKKSFRPLIH